jgi:hypothetical protein
VFPKLLAQNCQDFSTENTMYNKDIEKAGTARWTNIDNKQTQSWFILFIRSLLSNIIKLENTNVYSLEVSMYGYKPDKKSEKIEPYTEENCKIGRKILRQFIRLV